MRSNSRWPPAGCSTSATARAPPSRCGDAAGTTSLAIDGKVDASNAGDMLTQRLLAHVPLLLHPAPRQAAILGLGSGVTLGSALRHPLERVDVLEISPEVVEASRFFEPENSRALADPRTRLIVGDGRTHLLLGRDQYDVIVSEPSNPWMAGIASLFTREFFTAARARLAPGGVLCQWAHTYDISAEDLRSIVATFAAVFPDGTIWLVGDGDVLLIGGTEPMGPRVAALAEVWNRRPEAVADLAGGGRARPVRDALAAGRRGPRAGPLRGRRAAADRRLRPGRVLRPADGVLPQRRRQCRRACGPWRPNSPSRRSRRPGPPPPPVRGATAAGCCWRPPRLGPPGPTSRARCAATRATCGRSRAWCAPAPPPSAGPRPSRCCASWRHPADHIEAQLALSRFLASTGAVQEAAAMAFAVAERHPSDVAALEQLASILSDVGDKDRLLPVVSRLRAIAPTADADALLLRDAALPRRARQRGHRRGPAAGGQQSRARPRSQPARRRPGHGRPPRRRPRRVPRLAQGRAARSLHLHESRVARAREPATAPPACSGWPRR